MNIAKINNSLSFGKTPILTCQIINKNINTKAPSTLYKLDVNNPDDMKEVYYSKTARFMFCDMVQERDKRRKNREFYLLQDDKTQEVISCAQTSHRYRREDLQYPGLSTLIEVLDTNKKYVNGEEPLLSCIAREAQDRYDKSLVCAFYTEDDKTMKRTGFTKMTNGDWAMPEKRYENIINKAEQHSQIKYLI